jgi:hypothetical protein
LRSGNNCRLAANQLDILNIENLSAPTLVKTYGMNNPHGLSKDGNTLFICEGKGGLKIYNAENANDLKLLKHILDIETYDVIAYNNLALVVAKDGLYQFDYRDLGNVKLLSKISVKQ